MDDILKMNEKDFPIKGKKLEKWIEKYRKRGVVIGTEEESGETYYLINMKKIPQKIYTPSNPNKIIDVEIAHTCFGKPYANLIFNDGKIEKVFLD